MDWRNTLAKTRNDNPGMAFKEVLKTASANYKKGEKKGEKKGVKSSEREDKKGGRL